MYTDLSGKQYGRLTVVKKTGERRGKSGSVVWECVCSCGNTSYVSTSKLTSGHTKSCGCFSREVCGDTHREHGGTGTRLYNVWLSMKSRCNNKNDEAYKSYGGRGIFVCEQWENSFASFMEWALSSGYDKNAKRGNCTIDRIDNNKGYSPDNCRWVNMSTQGKNKRNNVYITANGETHILADWARITGIDKRTIHQRLKRGRSGEKAVMTGVSL